jgi:polyisoprenoid-binding protein YceI
MQTFTRRSLIGLAILAGCFLGVADHLVHSASIPPSISIAKFRLEPSQSKFIVHANRSGLAWFKGHSHRLAVGDFSGTAELDLSAVNPASLEISVRTASIEETDPVFTPEQKKIIKKELDELVLESAKYPEIVFKSTDVKGSLIQGKFDVRIGGDLTLHGVTKHIVIPAIVTVAGDSFRATGEFEIDRKDFNVNATDAFHGLVRVKHDLRFEFDIVGKRV